MALTDTKVRSAKSETKEYSLVDGEGMFLLIHPNGSKYWRFRFRFGGKQQLMAFTQRHLWLMPENWLRQALTPANKSVQ